MNPNCGYDLDKSLEILNYLSYISADDMRDVAGGFNIDIVSAMIASSSNTFESPRLAAIMCWSVMMGVRVMLAEMVKYETKH